MILDNKVQSQCSEFFNSWCQAAISSFVFAIIIFGYSRTGLLGAGFAKEALKEIESWVLPNMAFLVIAVISCCMCLLFTSYPVVDRLLRKGIAQRCMAGAFQLCATASGAVIPVLLIKLDTVSLLDIVKLVVLFEVWFLILGIMLWIGKWVISDEIHEYVEQHPSLRNKSIISITAALIIFVFLTLAVKGLANT